MSDFWKDYEPEPTRAAPMTTNMALDLALETLESIQAAYPCETVGKRITAIKQARSAPEEPVYHLRQYGDVTKEQLDRYMATGDINPQPAPVQEPVAWVGLTDEEIYKIDCLLITDITELVIAIEAKLKEKNNG
jgi:hypothetical protein